MPLKRWQDRLVRTWGEAGDNAIGLISAGIALYGFLALVPLLGAFVLSYGLVAYPRAVMQNMQSLTSVMPADAAKPVGEQLMNVVKTSDGKKGLDLLLALGVVMWLLLTLGFRALSRQLRRLHAPFSSLGAVVVLLTWFYLSSYILLNPLVLDSRSYERVHAKVSVGLLVAPARFERPVGGICE